MNAENKTRWIGWLGLAGTLSAARMLLGADPDALDLRLGALDALQRKVEARGLTHPASDATDEFPPGWPLSFEELEALYLRDEITARQFQKYIVALKNAPPSPPVPPPFLPTALGADTNAVLDHAIEVLRHTEPDPSKNPEPGPAIRADQLPLLEPGGDPAEIPPVDEDFVQIESKMDELLKLRNQREQSSVTNQLDAATDEQGRPLRKRDRLNALLRLHVYGKISKEEYDQRRAKILAEKDPPAEATGARNPP